MPPSDNVEPLLLGTAAESMVVSGGVSLDDDAVLGYTIAKVELNSNTENNSESIGNFN